jgi:hypothetical protein
MEEMSHLTDVYAEILELYRTGEKSYYERSFYGMTAKDLKKLDQQIVCEFLAKLNDYVPEFTAARNYKPAILDKEKK